MKILHLSDLHGVDRYYSWIQEEVRRTHYDALVVAGDLLNLFELEYIQTQIVAVKAWCDSLPPELPTLLVTGNHDKFEGHLQLHRGRWLRLLKRQNLYVDDDAVDLEGFCFECVGWGRVPVAESKLPKIVVSHSAPLRSLAGIDREGDDLGDLEISHHILSSPSSTWLVLSGHVHEPKRWYDLGEIECLNPAMDLRATTPNHIVIDTDAGTATWHGKGRSQTIKLKPHD